jgi:phage/plasmid-like protein (TIGR03299 family)
MPAYFDDGFSVRQPMWHGLGAVLPDYPSREEAFRLSGQDWSVQQAPLYVQSRVTFGNTVEVPGHFAARRSDTGAVLAVHQDSYEVLQNSEGWDLAEAIVDQDQAIRYETAVTLKGGRVCSVLLRDESFTVPGDNSATVPYLLVSWAHDGSAAMVATATNIRVVCWNTLSFALEGGHRRFSFKHTKNVRSRIDAAKATVSGMRQNTQLYRDLASKLAATPVTVDDTIDFMRMLYPDPEFKGSLEGFRRSVAVVAKQRQQTLAFLQGGVTVPENQMRTAYGLLQAGVEYIDWSTRSKTAETRFSRTMLGSTPQERGVRYLHTHTVTQEGSPWPEQAELLRIELMPSKDYPEGRLGARRTVPVAWLKPDVVGTRKWKEATGETLA